PEGIHPDAGSQAAGALPTPPGATSEEVALGRRIYEGQIASAPCAGCHGTDAKGSPLGPDLTSGQWIWGDGSLAAIAHTITVGVPQPKKYGPPMPPMGGAPSCPRPSFRPLPPTSGRWVIAVEVDARRTPIGRQDRTDRGNTAQAARRRIDRFSVARRNRNAAQ